MARLLCALLLVCLVLLSSRTVSALFGGGDNEQRKKEAAATDSLKEGLELLKDPKNVREGTHACMAATIGILATCHAC
jgi:hypothetical protein